MTRADLCIGAAGSTAWERCALGLPTLQLVLADNQVAVALAMAAAGVSRPLPPPYTPDFANALASGLEQLSQPDAYRAMVRAASVLTDGSGAARLAARIAQTERYHA